MIGFMNQKALEKSIELGLVTFWSRTRQALWTKGETSGNVLHIESISLDCDRDSLLIQVKPSGPTCHKEPPPTGKAGSFAAIQYELRNLTEKGDFLSSSE